MAGNGFGGCNHRLKLDFQNGIASSSNLSMASLQGDFHIHVEPNFGYSVVVKIVVAVAEEENVQMFCEWNQYALCPEVEELMVCFVVTQFLQLLQKIHQEKFS